MTISKHTKLYHSFAGPIEPVFIHSFLISSVTFILSPCMLLSSIRKARAGSLTAQEPMKPLILDLAKYKPPTRQTCTAWGKSNSSECVKQGNCLPSSPGLTEWIAQFPCRFHLQLLSGCHDGLRLHSHVSGCQPSIPGSLNIAD